MDNIEFNGEQLENNTSVQTTAVESDIVEPKDIDTSSPYGKFKDATSLYKAYNELQSEFTRKCQRLSELENNKSDNVAMSTPDIDESSWQEHVNDFIKSHKHAMLYSKDITKALLEDESLKHDKNGLERAYSKVLESKHRTTDEMLSDKAFLDEYILNNEDIKKQIINNYINSINRAPITLGSGASAVTFAPTKAPTNLEEAKSVVEDMLKF